MVLLKKIWKEDSMNFVRAYSLMARRFHGMEEAGVRFSLGPPFFGFRAVND